MKLSFIFKDPAALSDGLCYDTRGEAPTVDFDNQVSGFQEIDKELREKYFDKGEYVTVEYDTETKEMRVVPREEY